MADDNRREDMQQGQPETPKKKKAGIGAARQALTVVFLLLFLVSSSMLFFDWYEGYIVQRDNDALKDLINSGTTDYGEDDIIERYRSLYELNNDFAGWIKIDDTPIDHVVVKRDNDFYVRRDFYGKDNRNGTIFIEQTCEINPKGQIIIIYGHNMASKDEKMFTSLRNYRDVDYYRQHPIIKFDTLYEECSYKIFGVVLMDSAPNPPYAEDEFFLFSNFADDDAFMNYIAEIRDCSYLDIPVEVTAEDKIIALVTCSYVFDDARYVIFAREVREGEDTSVDTAGAAKNEDMIVPGTFR